MKHEVYSDEFTDYLIALLTSEPIKIMLSGFKFNYSKNPKAKSSYKLKINELWAVVHGLDELKKNTQRDRGVQ